MASVIALVIVFGVLVTITAIGAARIETAHPPAGQFIEGEGICLQVAELGLARCLEAPLTEMPVILVPTNKSWKLSVCAIFLAGQWLHSSTVLT